MGCGTGAAGDQLWGRMQLVLACKSLQLAVVLQISHCQDGCLWARRISTATSPCS